MSDTDFFLNQTGGSVSTQLGTRLSNIKNQVLSTQSVIGIQPDNSTDAIPYTAFGKSLLSVSTLNGLVGLINQADTKVEVIDSATGQIDFTLDSAVKLSVRNAYTEVLNELRSLNIVPATDLEYNLGTSTKRYNYGYFRRIASNTSGQVAVGDGAGTAGTSSINIGMNAGGGTPDYSVSIGRGSNTIGHTRSIAIGYASGQNGGTAVDYTTSIGFQAGFGVSGSSVNQMKAYATAIGYSAGMNGLGTSAIAIGTNSGAGTSGSALKDYGISIGESSAKAGQGTNAIAIGYKAGETSSHDKTIILNATGVAVNSDGTDRCFIAPIRSGGFGNNLVYDTGSKEVQVGGVASMAGITTGSSTNPNTGIILYNNSVVSDARAISNSVLSNEICGLASSGSDQGQLRLSAGGNTTVTAKTYIDLFGNANNVMIFGTKGAEKMRIAGNDFVGIGNASPTERLDVGGNLKVSGNILPDSTASNRTIGASGNKFNNIHSTTFTGSLSGNASSATYTAIPDTRYVSQFTPKRPTASVAEFRARQQQEITELCEASAANSNLGVGNFWGISKTIVPWSDPSGGRMYQYYYSANGIVYFRKSDQAFPYNTEAWTAWRDASPDKCILTDSTDTITGTKTFSSDILVDADNQRKIASNGSALKEVHCHTAFLKSIEVHSTTAGDIATSAKPFNTLFVNNIGSSGTPVQTLYADVWATSATAGLRCANNLVLATDLALPTITWYDVNAKSMILVDTVNTTDGGKLSYDSANSEIVIGTTSPSVERLRLGSDLKTSVNILPTDANRMIGSSTAKFNTVYTSSILNPDSNLILGRGTTSTVAISASGMSVNSGSNPTEALFVNGNIKLTGNILPNVHNVPKIGTSNSDRFLEGWFGTVYGNGVALTSDRRLKDNIKPITNALETIMKMKPVEYKMKDRVRLHTGFIADEVKNLYNGEDWAVFVEAQDEFKTQSLQYTEIVAVLTSALQEVNNRLSKVEARKLVGNSVIDTSGLTEDFVRVYERLDFLESEVNKPVKPQLHRCVEISRINELFDRISNLECNESKSNSSEDFELIHSLMEKNHSLEMKVNELSDKLVVLETKLESRSKVESKSIDFLAESDGGLNMNEILQTKNYELEQRILKLEKQNKKLVQAVNRLLKTTDE